MTVTTGLHSLDDLLGGGLQPGSLTVYAGVSQAGMTTLLDTTVVGAALKNGTPTLLADLESLDRESRIQSAHSGVQLLSLQRGELSDLDEMRLAKSMASGSDRLRYTRSNSLPLLLADALDAEPKLIAVDGARYVKPGPGGESDLTSILVGLKELARSQGAAVVTTAPVNRFEVRAGDDPRISWLPIEFELHCDAVVMIRRWGSFKPVELEHAELFVVKNRYGRMGRVGVTADYTRARFLDDGQAEASAA